MRDLSLSRIYVLGESRGFAVTVSDSAPADGRPVLYYETWLGRDKAARRARELAMRSPSRIRRLARELNPELKDLRPIILATAMAS